MTDATRLTQMLNDLRLPTIKAVWSCFADQADQEDWPALAPLAEDEFAECARRRLERLIHHATLFELNVDSYRHRTAMENKLSRGRPSMRATLKTSHPVSLRETVDALQTRTSPPRACWLR
ncbi:hypothetical protein [Billgrantia endophytica]|uniref:Uncharacterized protein n=1 Tax=Billgrantia endophytica TaxID=2033802 RepID=A0A2N7TVU3_9GAMM|nr:hypothetical protein [Halomonas endophytica]PMR72299.1 hypothetical protein C1H69_21850 [Halomonas endophytica]